MVKTRKFEMLQAVKDCNPPFITHVASTVRTNPIPAGIRFTFLPVTLLTLGLVAVVLLGWSGARLVYAAQAGQGTAAYGGGEKIFQAHCVACHPGGGNVMNPDKPLNKSNHLKAYNSFVSFIRHPQEPMPTFPPDQVSDGDAKELYQYITKALVPAGQKK